jgi:putative endonuclease
MASKPRGLIYIGLTQELSDRTKEHKNFLINGFPEFYKVNRLVYFEKFIDYQSASLREKELNKWRNRDWVFSLVDEKNPKWEDLSEELVDV